jgi:hypothetical protein
MPRIDRGLHRVAHLVGGEQQIVLDLLFAQPDVAQAVVAHERSRVAVQAVVDEQLGAVLQCRQVVGVARGLVPHNPLAARGVRTEGEAEGSNQGQDQFFHS